MAPPRGRLPRDMSATPRAVPRRTGKSPIPALPLTVGRRAGLRYDGGMRAWIPFLLFSAVAAACSSANGDNKKRRVGQRRHRRDGRQRRARRRGRRGRDRRRLRRGRRHRRQRRTRRRSEDVRRGRGHQVLRRLRLLADAGREQRVVYLRLRRDRGERRRHRRRTSRSSGTAGRSSPSTVPPNGLTEVLPAVGRRQLKGPDTNTCGVATPLTASVHATGRRVPPDQHRAGDRVPVQRARVQTRRRPGGEGLGHVPGRPDLRATGVPPIGCFSYSNDASLLLADARR